MLIWMLAGVGVIASVALLARYDERTVRAEWRSLLSRGGLQALERLEAQLVAERRALAFTVDQAQLVDVGAWYLAELVPQRMRLLQLTARYARMVSALQPGPRLRLAPLARALRGLARSRTSRPQDLSALDAQLLASCRALAEDLVKGG
jgi:hypothetical protein